MGDDNPPNLALVPETPVHEREKEQAKRELAWDTREMAANLLRVIRGAGRPSELPQQIINLGEAILKVHEECRAWAIWSAMEDALQSGVPNRWEEPASTRHETTVARGALQLVASRLVYQRAQEAAGGREIHEGITELEQYRDRERTKYRQELAELRDEQRKPRKKIAVSAPKKAAPTPAAAPAADAKEKPKSTADWMRQRRLRDRQD